MIPSPFATKELLKNVAEKNKLMGSIPALSLLFIDTPLESTIDSQEFHGTAKGVIMQELKYRAQAGIKMDSLVMILVIERESLLGKMEETKSAMVTYSPETNMMACFKVQGQLVQ